MTSDIINQAKDLYNYIESEGLIQGDDSPLLEKLARLVPELINEVNKWHHIAIEERAKYLSAEEASGWDFKRGALCDCNDCTKESRFEKDRIRLRKQATEDMENIYE